MKNKSIKFLYLIFVIVALLGVLSSPVALILGFLFSLFFGNPFQKQSYSFIHFLLKVAVVGLGFGMRMKEVVEASKQGFGLTFFSIFLTVFLGLLFIKMLKINKEVGYLITSGTAICGGSAIAAISSVIKAKSKHISVALGIVFLLNSLALFVFPAIGSFFNLTQHQFGLWCAVAIHDTSSVVGAALCYGDESLKIATIVKLSRTLWIVPLSVLSMFVFKTPNRKIKIPYFILLFVLVIFINSLGIIPVDISGTIAFVAKRIMVVTLFIVGSTILIKDLKLIGIQPVVLAVFLWVFISVFSFIYILYL